MLSSTYSARCELEVCLVIVRGLNDSHPLLVRPLPLTLLLSIVMIVLPDDLFDTSYVHLYDL